MKNRLEILGWVFVVVLVISFLVSPFIGLGQYVIISLFFGLYCIISYKKEAELWKIS